MRRAAAVNEGQSARNWTKNVAEREVSKSDWIFSQCHVLRLPSSRAWQSAGYDLEHAGCKFLGHVGIYLLSLLTIVNNDNNTVLFADDTSIIITDTNRRDFTVNANQTFQDMNTWFKVNLLTLNFNKTQYLEWWNKSNKMQQLRFLFAMALLYMFRVTISPIIRSTVLYMATGELAHLGCY